jgi:hypothetical protein
LVATAAEDRLNISRNPHRVLRLGRARRFAVDVDVIDKWLSKECRPLFKKHESNKSLRLVILHNRRTEPDTPPQSRQFIAQAARLSSRAAFVWR